MGDIIFALIEIANKKFSQIIQKAELVGEKIRLTLSDSSFIEILYPVPEKYSFHWQRKRKIYRFDTAPHHRDLSTFPRHIHFGSENNILPDEILIGNNPEENFELFLQWVQELLEEEKQK